jgi:tRNA dimethylallyltransferase
MNIGTAKPSPQELARVPHHLIDIADPDQRFDAKQYARTAHEKIMELVSQATVPFVVGGTGFYIKALVHGLFRAESANDDIRTHLKEEAQSHGTDFLYERLSRCDPDAAARIKPNDSYRIVRALEIYQLTGKTISAYHHEHRFQDKPFRVLKIGLNMDRELLYDRINQRVDAMIAAGLVDEVKELLGRGYAPDLKAMQSIGYRHMVDFLKNRLSWHEAVRTLKRDTRRFAKRQLTWFKADSDIAWYTPGQLSDISRSIKKFLHLP